MIIYSYIIFMSSKTLAVEARKEIGKGKYSAFENKIEPISKNSREEAEST